jgi:hypothetical protein
MGNVLFEVETRSEAIRLGLIETVFESMEQVHVRILRLTADKRLKRVPPAEAMEKISIEELPEVEESILTTAVRCVRICGGDSESKNHLCRSRTIGKPDFENRNLCRLNGILKVGEPLTWREVNSLSDRLTFEILYALTVLTERMNGPTLEIIEDVSTSYGSANVHYLSIRYTNSMP